VEVEIRHDLPVGQGFSMSASGALAAALAVARVWGVPRQRAIEVAHLSDLFGGGGLGGVAAILGGGLEVRTRPGIPPWGHVTHRMIERPVLVGVVGPPIPSPRILGDSRVLDRIVRAARDLDSLGPRPDFEDFFVASERFTDRAGLAPKRLRDVVRGVRRRGGRAAQAMFGESFFASVPNEATRTKVLEWLRRGTVRAVELDLDRHGARLARTSR
jgi:pantoate kinase